MKNITNNPKLPHFIATHEAIETNEYCDTSDIRRIGNTTKIINHAIDLLLNGNLICIIDHIDDTKLNNLLFDKLIRRLDYEHNHVMNDLFTFKHNNKNYLFYEPKPIFNI